MLVMAETMSLAGPFWSFQSNRPLNRPREKIRPDVAENCGAFGKCGLHQITFAEPSPIQIMLNRGANGGVF